jgi:hypothetical protein
MEHLRPIIRGTAIEIANALLAERYDEKGGPNTKEDVNAFVAQAFRHRTFFTRLHQLAITSDAFIVAPGGSVQSWKW